MLHGDGLVPPAVVQLLARVVHQIAGPVVGHDGFGRRALVLEIADQFLAAVAGRLFQIPLGRLHLLHGLAVARRLVSQRVPRLHETGGPEDGPLLLDEHVEKVDLAFAFALPLRQEHVLVERPDLHEIHFRGHPHGRVVVLLRLPDSLVGEHVVVVEHELVEIDPGRGLVARSRVCPGRIIRGLRRRGLEPGRIERDRHGLPARERDFDPQVVEAVRGSAADLHRDGVDLARPLVSARLHDLEDRFERLLVGLLVVGFRDGGIRLLGDRSGRAGERGDDRVARPGQAQRPLQRHEQDRQAAERERDRAGDHPRGPPRLADAVHGVAVQCPPHGRRAIVHRRGLDARRHPQPDLRAEALGVIRYLRHAAEPPQGHDPARHQAAGHHGEHRPHEAGDRRGFGRDVRGCAPPQVDHVGRQHHDAHRDRDERRRP